jgi:hypothetical protein
MNAITAIPFIAVALGVATPIAAQEMPETTAPATAAALDNPEVVTVRNISHIELEPGTPIVDETGKIIGTVSKVAGNTIILTDGTDQFEVPITQLYAYTQYGTEHFASRLPRTSMASAR